MIDGDYTSLRTTDE